MNTFSDMKVGTKLLFSFGILVALLVAIGAMAAWQISSINDKITQILDDRYAKVILATGIDQAVNLQARNLRNAIIGAKDPEEVSRTLAKVDQGVATNNELMAKLPKSINTPKGRELFDAMKVTREKYVEARTEAIRLLKEGKAEEAGAYVLKNVRPPQDAFFTAIEAMVVYQTGKMTQEGEEAKAAGKSAIQMIAMTGLIAAIAAIAMAIAITRNLTRQLGGEPRQVVGIANAIAGGDLEVAIHLLPNDTDSIMAAMNRMKDNLARIVEQVRNISESIASGSSQIATGNADLSQRTEEQASNLQQTAASMEELSSTIKANADTTSQANQLAVQASAAAVKGGDTVGAVMATMQDIATSSKRIADIIGVIDGIAFQTNILALNAAVEAARAGEQGRGFAVVASEVRSLAGRSAEAAKEIKSLIGSSVEKVELGAQQVNDASASMGAIVEQVQRVTQLIGEVSSATSEQSTGVGQVSDAVSQLDQVTQQNAALVEESAAAADSLKNQSISLADAVSVFKIRRGAVLPALTQTRPPRNMLPSKVPVQLRTVATPSLGKPKAKASVSKPSNSLPRVAMNKSADDAWETF